jgi:hypothetical protein
MEIEGELVKDPFQMGGHIHVPLFAGVQRRHQDPTGVGPGIRPRAAADVAGDNGGAPVAFGEVVLVGYPPVIGPVIEAVGIGPEVLLQAVDAEMLRRHFHRRHDLKRDRCRVNCPATGLVYGQEWSRSGQDSASRSALASWRSAVSKPAVNQP